MSLDISCEAYNCEIIIHISVESFFIQGLVVGPKGGCVVLVSNKSLPDFVVCQNEFCDCV